MTNESPDTVRAAAYLATRERFDLKGRLKCNPPNRECGDRCIPPNWNCRVKGEGGDSHSRVVAGDPLAGAASIARGKKRLIAGLKTGSLTDIQGGRAAIERGIVKAVPGQNIKQKQALRKNVNRVLLPIASTVFGIWALNRGHEGLKLMVPQYRNGLGKNIEESMTQAITWGLDRVPVAGGLRIAQRRAAGVEAQRLGRAVARGVSFDPASSTSSEVYFPRVSTRERGAFVGLDTAINDTYGRFKGGGKGYERFRSGILSSTIGANTSGKSLYSEAAAAHHLARQFSIDPSTITNSSGTEARFHVLNKISASLENARVSMRMDMAQRGLDFRNPADVDAYVQIARSAAAPRMQGVPPEMGTKAQDQFGGWIRDIVSRGPKATDQISTFAKAKEIFADTEAGFDKAFGEFSRSIKENTSPTTRVIASGSEGASIRSALIGTATRVKRDVGLRDDYTIRGANHAELVLQKVFHEKVVPGNFKAGTRSTWTATDSAIRYAAQDMGWKGTNVDEAVDYLRENGFSRLARRPVAATPTRAPRPSTGVTRPARRRLRSRAELISTLTRGGLSPEAAAAEADRIIARRGDSDDWSPELIRAAAYLALRTDLQEGRRLGKPCGESHIPKAHDCHKNAGAKDTLKTVATVALATGVAAGATALFLRNSSNYGPSKSFDSTHGVDFNNPEFARRHYEVIRTRGRAFTSTEMRDQILQIADNPLVHRANVERCATWIEMRDIGLDPRALDKLPARENRGKRICIQERDTLGAYFEGHDQKIWVRRRGHLDRWDATAPRAAVEGTHQSLDAVQRSLQPREGLSAQELKRIRNDSVLIGRGMRNRSGQDLVTFVHEVGHSVHYRGSKLSVKPFPVEVRGRIRTIDPRSPRFQSQLDKFRTEYGNHSMSEAFAEAHVAYVFAGQRLRREAPLVHAWVEYQYDQAIQNHQRGRIK